METNIALSSIGKPSCKVCVSARNAGAKFCPECGNSLETSQNSGEVPIKESVLGMQPVKQNIIVREISEPKTNDPSIIEEMAQAGSLPNQPISSTENPMNSGSHTDTVHPQTSEIAIQSPVCPNCGKPLSSEARYCLICGTPIGRSSTRYYLVRKNKDGTGTELPLDKDETILGKSSDCDLVIGQDDFISRRHARFVLSKGLLFVEDLKSSNGSYLRIQRPMVLEVDDEIVLGTTVLQFKQRSTQ